MNIAPRDAASDQLNSKPVTCGIGIKQYQLLNGPCPKKIIRGVI